MTDSRHSPGVELTLGLYALLSRFQPRRVQDQFGADMLTDFEQQLSEARDTSRVRMFGVAMSGVIDVVLSAVGAHIYERRRDEAARAALVNRRETLMSSFWLDLRHTLRGLRGSLTFTIVTIVVLAIGLGANTAMFSLVRGVLMKPLPFDEPEELVWLIESVPAMNMPMFPFNAPDVQDLDSFSTTLGEVGSFQSREVELSSGGEPMTAVTTRVTANLFPLLGLEPALGRVFQPEEDVPRSGVVIISYRLWQERFGGATDVLDQRIELDRVPHTVVGVMRQSDQFPLRSMPLHGTPADLYVPMGFTQIELSNRGMMHNLGVIARLADGQGFEAAEAEMATLGARILESYPGAAQSPDLELHVLMSRLRDVVVGDFERPLLLLLGAMGLVLLVVCANVANLTLSRSMARSGEMAVRAALGATRKRLAQIYLLESVILALAGGVLGLVFAAGVLRLSQLTLSENLPLVERISIDPWVVFFVAGLSFVVAFLFGWVPLYGGVAKAEGVAGASPRRTGGRAQQQLLKGVAVVTMALAVVLLVGAGLLLRSFGRLLALDPGFAGERVLSMTLSLPNQAYPDPQRVLGFVDQLEDDLAALPGVEAVTIASALPLEARERRAVVAENALDPNARHSVVVTWASPDFVEALGIELRSGRSFTDSDRADAPAVVIASEQLARQHWGRADVIGERMSWRLSETGEPIFAEVVGVVGAVNDGPLGSEPSPHLYVPLAQFDQRELVMATQTDSPWGRVFRVALLSATDDPTTLIKPALARIAAADPSLAVSDVESLQRTLDGGVLAQRFSAWLVTVFAATALLLAAIGLYGVLAYATDRRRREIGVRLALGADGSSVVRLVMLQGLVLAGVGLSFGLLAALGLSRFMRSVLYETSTSDAATLALVAVVLLFSALLASWLPAWRAGRVDPVSTLRPE